MSMMATQEQQNPRRHSIRSRRIHRGSRRNHSKRWEFANDPNFVVQFAVGDPIPNLVPQSKGSGVQIIMAGVYFDTAKRYIMKNCHMSREDVSNVMVHCIILLIIACHEHTCHCLFYSSNI
jgi:hypothetical protein